MGEALLGFLLMVGCFLSKGSRRTEVGRVMTT